MNLAFRVFASAAPNTFATSQPFARALSRVMVFTGLFICLTALSASAGTDSRAKAFVLCKNQKSVRTIRILGDKADNCTITYSKNGTEEVVGANRSVQTCRSILKSIEGRLEEAKWSCRNVETAHLTTSSEAASIQ